MHASLASLSSHWHQCSGDIPPPLVGASTTIVPAGKLYLFGGRLVSTRRMVADLYELDLEHLLWRKVSSAEPSSSSLSANGSTTPPPRLPRPRYFHTADVWKEKIIFFGGMGYAEGGNEELCVLDEVLAFDLATQSWDLDFGSPPSASSSPPPGSPDYRPPPRYAHLSALTSDRLVIIGGQDMNNVYVEEINVFDLPSRRWIHTVAHPRQCGSYRSLAVSAAWELQGGGHMEDGSDSQLGVVNGGGRRSRSGSAAASASGAASNASGRARGDSAASTGTVPSQTPTSSSHSYAASWRDSSVTGSSSSITALTTPASTLSGAAGGGGGGGGGGDARNSFHQQQLPGSSSGSLASPISATAPGRLPTPLSRLPVSVPPQPERPLPVFVYSNYNFTDVKRELEVLAFTPAAGSAPTGNRFLTTQPPSSASGRVSPSTSDIATPTPTHPGFGASASSSAPPPVTITERSASMSGVALPPGLRFPTGAILGHHMIICGTYLANTSQTFSIWSLDLRTLTWSRIDAGSTFASGSWNRGVLWAGAPAGASKLAGRNRLVVLGHKGRDLVEDYNHRQTNFEHVAFVELESFGIYQPPVRRMAAEAEEWALEFLAGFPPGGGLGMGASSGGGGGGEGAVGLAAGADFEVIAEDGRSVPASRKVLIDRWPWFKDRMADWARQTKAAAKQLDLLGDDDEILIDDDDGGSGGGGGGTDTEKDPTAGLPTRLLPRHLQMPLPLPVVLAFLQYLHTLSLCTPLQLHPSVLASLLVLAKTYSLVDLGDWVTHAAHVALSRDAAGSSARAQASTSTSTSAPVPAPAPFVDAATAAKNAVGVYEMASLGGCTALQVRALKAVMSSNKRTTQQADPRQSLASSGLTSSSVAQSSGRSAAQARRWSLTLQGQAAERTEPPAGSIPPAPQGTAAPSSFRPGAYPAQAGSKPSSVSSIHSAAAAAQTNDIMRSRSEQGQRPAAVGPRTTTAENDGSLDDDGGSSVGSLFDEETEFGRRPKRTVASKADRILGLATQDAVRSVTPSGLVSVSGDGGSRFRRGQQQPAPPSASLNIKSTLGKKRFSNIFRSSERSPPSTAPPSSVPSLSSGVSDAHQSSSPSSSYFHMGQPSPSSAQGFLPTSTTSPHKATFGPPGGGYDGQIAHRPSVEALGSGGPFSPGGRPPRAMTPGGMRAGPPPPLRPSGPGGGLVPGGPPGPFSPSSMAMAPNTPTTPNLAGSFIDAHSHPHELHRRR